jgi:hypothetical protein
MFPTHPQELEKLVKMESGLVEIPGQGQCHWMTTVPIDFDRVTKVVVFFHGLGDHVGANYQNEIIVCVGAPRGGDPCS